MESAALSGELEREYENRFRPLQEYRDKIWRILTADFFQRYVSPEANVLDLGCGWGEFINNIQCAKKYGMDLNPAGHEHLNPNVVFLQQDCSKEWTLPSQSLDVVFSSNFFEHLPSKDHLKSVLAEAYRCLKPGGSIICIGPNVKFLPGSYWDFWDHYIPLTELSLKEVLELTGYKVTSCIPKFLPYTMVNRSPAPLTFVKIYLHVPILWKFFGRQFLVIASKSKL